LGGEELFLDDVCFLFSYYLEKQVMGTNNSIFSPLCPQTACHTSNSDLPSKVRSPVHFLWNYLL